MNNSEVGILILAAGSSSRMGTSKQLLLVNGEVLLINTIKTAVKTGLQNILVVLGSDDEHHRKAIKDLPVKIAFNSKWVKGMGSSVKVGLKHFHAQNNNKAIIILVCDQPLLSAKIILSLIEKHKTSGKSIIASGYANTFGVPAFFTSGFFPALLALKNDQGAKKIIFENPSEVDFIEFPQGEIDLDTPDDYNNFIKNQKT
jgi:molybdenum cofactor cytidylyltransferase